MITSLWDIAVSIMGTAIVLAQTATPSTSPLPQLPRNSLPGGANIFNRASSTLVTTPFTADPTVQTQPTGTAEVEAFIYNNAECVYAGQSLWYRLYVGNPGSVAARSVNVQFQYPAGTTITASDPTPDRQDVARRLYEWSIPALAPRGGYSQYSLTAQIQTTGSKQSILIVTYLDEQGQVKQVVTTHTLPSDCGQPDAPTQPRSSRLPAIFCDPAETSCVPFLPNLGVRFGESPKHFTETDKPLLGARYAEAVADIIPGDCRVGADDVITKPEYQDALNRLYNPADFFMEPLYTSGLDFKQLVHENDLLGIGFMKEARKKLQDLHTSMWQEHVQILNLVTTGRISGQQGQERLQALLSRWQGNLDDIQSQLDTQYAQMQSSRRTKFPPVAERAIKNAKDSMQRACNTSSDGGLEPLLPAVREQYNQTLDLRRALFAQTQLRFRSLTSVAGLWQQRLYPALQNHDNGDDKPLDQYLLDQGQYSQKSFEALFTIYTKHQSDDTAAFEQVRLEAFEKALDTPKTAATACEKDKVFQQPVETTFCESNENGQIPQVLGPEAVQERIKKKGLARPPEGITEQEATAGVTINEEAVKGKACQPTPELPGAPWWSKGCECKCNDQVPTVDNEGNITFTSCQEKYEIVRHDQAVESQAECFAQAEHHPDLYF